MHGRPPHCSGLILILSIRLDINENSVRFQAVKIRSFISTRLRNKVAAEQFTIPLTVIDYNAHESARRVRGYPSLRGLLSEGRGRALFRVRNFERRARLARRVGR